MRFFPLARIGFVSVVVTCVSASTCAAPTQVVSNSSAQQLIADHAIELIDPLADAVLLPGASDATREFTAALALAPYDTIAPYLTQLAGEWSAADSLYGPTKQVSSQAEASRLAVELASLSPDYRQHLFPPDRIRTMQARASSSDSTATDVDATVAATLRLLNQPALQLDCAGITAAVVHGDLESASRLRGQQVPQIRCGPTNDTVISVARAQSTKLAAEIGRWSAPQASQITDLWSRLAWTSSYPAEQMSTALQPFLTAIEKYLAEYVQAVGPFVPPFPADQLQLLFQLIRSAQPTWRPDPAYLSSLRRTLTWHGRLPEQVDNDPTTFIYTFALLANSTQPAVIATLPSLRAGLLQATTQTPLDRGLRAVAAQRADLITETMLNDAANQVGDDPRLGARLAAMMSYSRQCPQPADRVLQAQASAIPAGTALSLTSIYYYAVISRVLDQCPNRDTSRHSSSLVAAAINSHPAPMVPTAVTGESWQSWFELWLLAESACAVGVSPRLDGPALNQAADQLAAGPADTVWSTYEPTAAYAVIRALAIANHGCAGAWFAP